VQRCLGVTRNLNRCGRTGTWALFCPEHRLQPLVASSFLVFTVLAGIASMQSAWWHPNSHGATGFASFSPQMRLQYEGFFRLNLVNTGSLPSGDGHVEVISWADGAPAEDMMVRESFPNLIPGADWSYDIDLLAARARHSGGSGPRGQISGYFALWCDHCKRPQAWAFHIPVNMEEWPRAWADGITPLSEFRYPKDKPGVGSRVPMAIPRAEE
jgi:hypothetical protein